MRHGPRLPGAQPTLVGEHPADAGSFGRLSFDVSCSLYDSRRRARARLCQQTDAIYDRIALRIMPFPVLLFVVAWLDRINVGFARSQMVKDLGFRDAVYGFGAGIFYLGYLLFEIPSNPLLNQSAHATHSRGSP